MVRSPDGVTDFFEILAGVLQGDTLAPFLVVIALDYVLRTSVDLNNHLGFTLQKARSRRYPAKKITDADYADDLALFADKITDAEKLLHSLEEAAAGIGLYVNGTSLKEVDHFSYLGSDISSTEKDVMIRIAKAWSALDKLRTI